MKKIIQTDLEDIKDRYGDERRTQIVPQEGEIKLEDMIKSEEQIVTITHKGYIKRMAD